MAAPKNNTFWKNRSKHGREKIFATPNDLLEAAYEYFQWCDDNPWIKVDFKGKDSGRVEIPTQSPYTISGLCLFLEIDEDTFSNYGTKETYQDFFGVITRVRNIIYTQKFEGAVVGGFNANIISRELGLSDKKEMNISGSVSNEPPVILVIE